MMNLTQTKLVGLTMELDLKTREYKKLCDKLEYLKQSNIKANDEKLLELRLLFQKNHDEIVKINRKIKELKETEELLERQKLKKYNLDNLFKRKNDKISISNEEKNRKLLVCETKRNIFEKLIKKIIEIFNKNNK